MAAPTNRAVIEAARSNLLDARLEIARFLFDRAQARQALAQAMREHVPTDPPHPDVAAAQAALDAAEALLVEARNDEVIHRGTLATGISDWLKDTVTHDFLTPDADVQRLTSPHACVVLLPVRIETRFDIPAATLRVRIYPDEIYSDIHEKELTPEEKALGDSFWQEDHRGSENADLLEFWTPIADRFGAARAAYIVRVTDPERPGPRPRMRATSPRRQAEAVLPDRWVVRAYRNGELRKTGIGQPIPEPLSLTPDPSDENQTFEQIAVDFSVPTSIAWTAKYSIAKDQGMAVDLDQLTSDDLTLGFDRLVVIGVKTSMDQNDGGQFLIDMLDGHHYSRGLALVPQGTATNNIPGRPTPFTMTEPPTPDSFRTERGPVALRKFDTFGANVSFKNDRPDSLDIEELLGELNDVFSHVRGAEGLNPQRETNLSACMNVALWPATLGYFLEQMMNPWTFLNDPANNPSRAIFSDTLIAAIRTFFIDNVFGRGPGPAFRIGAVPYGVLPAIALSRWTVRPGENTVFPETMRRLLPYWQAAAAKLPAVTRASQDRNVDLMTVLSQKASSDSVFVRNSLGIQTVTNILELQALEYGVAADAMKHITDPILTSLAHVDWASSRILELTFLGSAYKYKGPLVTAATPPSGKFDDASNYIKKLASAGLTIADIESQDTMTEPGPAPKPLLFLMLRHALLLNTVRIGRRLRPAAFAAVTRLDQELIIINESPTTVFDVLKQSDSGTNVFGIIKQDSEYKFFMAALDILSKQPIRDLERMFTESLDLCSHRLDAWTTGLATRRLRQNGIENFDENFVGGYGWVEDVRPTARTARAVDGFTAQVQQGNGGFIHAPSMRHASAAAIMRSGRMAEKSDPTKYAIELPSERTRRAHRLADGMRNEQPLGALLGYEFERGLRARKVPGTEGFILALRKLYPLVANKSGNDGADPADRIAARNVVDGKLLREAAKPIGPGLPWSTHDLPSETSAGGQAISGEVGRLNEIVDSFADLALSETVFQMAGGDVATAGAVMSSLSEGERPPEAELTQSPTVGSAVNHRAAMIFQGVATPAAVAGWSVTTPRARLERWLDGYVANLLGTIIDVTAKIEYTQGGVAKTDPAFALSNLAIGALDFVALAQAPGTAGQGSVLDRRLKDAFLAVAANAGATITRITYNPPPAPALPTDPPGRSVPQLLEVARATATFIGQAREMRPTDLRRTDDPFVTPTLDDVVTFGYNDIVLTRTGGAETALASALQALDGDPRAGLKSVADFIPEAYPDPDATAAELAIAVDGARAELKRRQTDYFATKLPQTNTNLAPQLEAAITALRIVFGRSSFAITQPFELSWGDELTQSLAALKPADTAPLADRQAPERYLQQMMRVRDRLGSWRRVGLYGGALGRKAPPVAVAQLPFVEGETWAGRNVPADQGRLSLLILSGDKTPPAQPDTSKMWRGLILDEWTETVPGNTVQTGLAFHYDSQAAKAPQSILVCVHSDTGTTWGFTEIEAIVNETIDLARIRPVDSDMISLGALMPAVLLAANTQNKTVSTLIPKTSLEIPPIIVG